jgi:hypothetical protein
MTAGSTTESIDAVASWVDNANTSGSWTITTAKLINGSVRQSGQTAAMNLTLPSSAAIVAALKGGDSFEFVLVNNNSSSGAVTIVAGDAGTTLVGTTACAINTTRVYKAIVTDFVAGAEAVSFVGLGYMTAP